MVYRVYVEKKSELAQEAANLLHEVRELLRVENLTAVRVINRYDVEEISEELFSKAVQSVFSQPQLDNVFFELPQAKHLFAVEQLPGQFDQRADSAAQCIQILSQGQRPLVRSGKVYILEGELTDADIAAIKGYVINPVEAREASLALPEHLSLDAKAPEKVAILDGFIQMDKAELEAFFHKMGLAMDLDDLAFCQDYFRKEGRDPSMTELRTIDTYWSDHCRHTTFHTQIDDVKFNDPLLEEAYNDYLETRKELGRTKPVCLMDLGTLAAKYLKKQGLMDKMDESEEINACTIKTTVHVDGKAEPWLLLFKNETHNHPTEIEPFGGAATCIGGAIRDPLASRAYVYAAMRLTGAANPLVPVSETMEGKLPQRNITTSAAAGYSSYGNQIGLATGMVDELYHPGYAAKRMEVGAVVAAVPEANVRRQRPEPGDKVILLGGRTGRDGCGGATGSSQSHTLHSLETCGAQVQKGNAPEERKLQRLFRNPQASLMIKRCNDFGAGGVSVAIGELADGLEINLSRVPKKYEGLDGTELAISESQERMAVVVEAQDVEAFLKIADQENLEATVVATVTENPRLRMHWNDDVIVDLSREFLDSNGAEKHITVEVEAPKAYKVPVEGDFAENFKKLTSNLNTCSHQGLSERFDSTIGAGTVLMPFGGKNQKTPIQAMVHKVSLEKGHTGDCSMMSWGCNPWIAEKSPYHGGYLAVVDSAAKLVATGSSFKDVYLSFQEYFPRLGQDEKRWGMPMAALLGAFEAQKNLKIAAIGGKDSMSGTFESLDVPPTLISFAVTTEPVEHIVSNEFKEAGHPVVLLRTETDENGLPKTDSLLENFKIVSELLHSGLAVAAYTPGVGGAAEAVMKMCFGNGYGFRFDEARTMEEIFGETSGSFVLELTQKMNVGVALGEILAQPKFLYKDAELDAKEIQEAYEATLEPVFPTKAKAAPGPIETISQPCTRRVAPAIKVARPKVLIPAFPGTNCEYDSARVVEDAGAEAEIFVVRNLNADAISHSVESFAEKLKSAQMMFLPGGFSGGDEPDGSGKFITAFLRNPAIKEQVHELLNKRDGLILGICNGFQALIQLGLVPYGRILDADASMPTLCANRIARHQSRMVRTRIASNVSPWLSLTNVGDVFTVPISHGEGRLLGDPELLEQLAKNGQVATQYVDFEDEATGENPFNPNGSQWAIEGICSPDGRVLGKMGHSERRGPGLYKNIPGEHDMKLFESAVRYFR